MPMIHQPSGVSRTGLGSERPPRAHRITLDGKFAGYTVRLTPDDKPVTWLALSPDGGMLGETLTHTEAVEMLAPDAKAKPRKTSVYLDAETAQAARKDGRTLSDLIRAGLTVT